jgi:alkanesulfonate monooxygenase SsuD/methylene tetrahydromethanopterin reductase-like flavin-dependent oxidoreductase (luciferase family)
VDHLSHGRVNVGVGSGWMPEEFAASSASHIFPKRHKHVRETIEIMQGVWTNDLFEYHGEFADFDRCGFGAKPAQKPHPPIFFSGLKDPKRSASRIAEYGLSGWIGIQDTPDELEQWRRCSLPATRCYGYPARRSTSTEASSHAGLHRGLTTGPDRAIGRAKCTLGLRGRSAAVRARHAGPDDWREPQWPTH